MVVQGLVQGYFFTCVAGQLQVMIKAIVNQLTLEQIKTHRYEQLHLLTVNQTKYFYSTFCSHDLLAQKITRSNRWGPL